MKDFVKKIIAEYDDLIVLTERLDRFIESRKINNLEKIEQNRLKEQLDAMNTYADILYERLTYYNVKQNENGDFIDG